nr:hypothetical protein [Phycisphaerae bacterium]NIS53913.1 hypothetical protein [Phycisphaerae bacterium]NIX31409.1 hypothetical protein [Phycisphaerae bacterium]
KQLKHYFKTGPIVSVTHFPTDFGQNIVVDWPSSVLSMFKQVLLGLETIEADVIYLAEHDVIYHPSHFRFTPPKKDVFYYNHNSWRVRTKDGQAVFYYTKKTSQVCGYKDMFVEHYRNRVKKVEAEGFRRAMGYEPGTHKPPRGFDHFTSDVYESKHPNVDIRHANNLTWSRFKKSQFRRQPKGWQLADEIPHWGKTKGRFEQFIKDIERNLDK